MIRRERGLSLLEILVALALLAVLLSLALPNWQRSMAMQSLRYGTEQLATDLRETQERAKAERKSYTVTLQAGNPVYFVRRNGGGFDHRGELPRGVAPTTNATVTFNPFGQPDGAYTIQVQNPVGVGTVRVSPAGGIETEVP